jgi:chaperonin GroES
MPTKKKPTARPKAAPKPAAKPKAAAPKPEPAKAHKAPKVRPLGDRILVKLLEAQDVVKGGIIIPDSAKEKRQDGIVVAVGDGRKTSAGKTIPFEVKVGDRVMIEKYTGSEITFDNDEYTIIKEEGVLAIIG